MEKNGEHSSVGVLSPNRITRYFASSPKTELLHKKDSDDNTEFSDKNSSVYLTPKSSPFKDNQDYACQTQNVPPKDSCNSHSSLPHKSHISCNSNKSTSDSESNQTSKPETNEDNLTPIDSTIQNSKESSSHPSKRRSNPHRICHVTQFSGQEENSEQVPAAENIAVSSPSLLRSKVRKNSKLKSSKIELESSTTTQASAPPSSVKSKPTRRKKVEPIQTTTITDYFPIRRSGRQTKSQIEKETQMHQEKLILSHCEDGLEVKEIEGKGRGVVATKLFDKGDFVVEYAGDLLDIETAKSRESDYALSPNIGCYMYFFNHGTKQYCIDATQESGRLGRLINHSRGGNCATRVVVLDGKPHLILVASKHIKSGEELSYDYGDRSKSALEAHPWLKL